MDRRSFLKSSGAAVALAGLAACGAPKKDAPASTGGEIKIEGPMLEHYPGIGVLGYGCMRWPMTKDDRGNEIIDQETVNSLVDEALAHGVNYFDTSPVYLRGDSERATAEALNRYPREKWLLATKLSNFADASYENSVKMYRRSLETFKTDHIDYYLLHSIGSAEDFKRRFEDTGIMQFLLKEREKGTIRHLGFSIHSHKEGFDSMMELHPKYHWDFVQIQMNYLDWTHAGGRNTNADHMYEQLAARDIPVVIMEPLRGGGLASLTKSQTALLKEREPDRSVASWAFRFVGSFPKVLTALSGMTYREHLEDNLRTFCNFKPLVEEEFELLEQIAEEQSNFPLVGCTGCQYCMPCPYGINIPGVFRFYDNSVVEGTYVKGPEQEKYAKARRRYLAEYNKAVESVRQADHCISCGKCMKACPQHIRIPRELKRIDEYIEKIKQDLL
ncbi:MAG: aldo/keto reductase [Bacteroidales bacterium]|nr:aldo/keto reductase [Bacteroidales bacterium]MBQ2107645.1 aldo/keto reductase [Bacteroidales bacterium]MBQ4026400.1 aldo/keto reductase [Bacteroidales bacterium]